MERAFQAHLNKVWPLWRQHEGGTMWHLMRRSFEAGYVAGQRVKKKPKGKAKK